MLIVAERINASRKPVRAALERQVPLGANERRVLSALALWTGTLGAATVTQLLGQPTDRSITLNTRADAALEAVEPLGHRRQRDPERVVLALVPAGSQAEDEAALGEHVQIVRGVGELHRTPRQCDRDRRRDDR